MLKFSGISSLPHAARRFVEREAQTFDQTLPWLEEFESHIVKTDKFVSVIGLADPGTSDVVALMPLHRGQVHIGAGLRGVALQSLSNYYTAFYGPLLAPTVDQNTLRRLAAALVDTAACSNIVDLSPMSESSDFIGECTRAFESDGWLTETYARFGNWFVPTQGQSYAEYLNGRPGQTRSTIKRKVKKLQVRGGSFRVVTDEHQVDEAMNLYESIYIRSWKTDEPYKEFIRAVCRRFAARGWLRLGLVEIDGVPAAAQLWFVYRGTASIFKLAYDPAFDDLSVGSLLTAHLMQRVIDVDRVDIVDYLCGDDPYKKDWMTQRRQRVGFRATRARSLVGCVEIFRRVTRSARDTLSSAFART